MTTPAIRLNYSFADYLRFENDAAERHEYVRGLIVAMAGGTLEHAALAAQVIAMLARQLAGKRCRVFDSNARLRIAETGNAFYPDASVICGSLEVDPEDPRSMQNPVVLIEVLSPSTAEFDRTDKLDDYRTVPSVQHIVYVAHDQHRLTVHSRHDSEWVVTELGPGQAANLAAIGCSLDVDDLYRDPLA